jgi:hypothetical protein
MLLSFLLPFNLLSTKVILLVNNQAMLNYFKEAKTLKNVLYNTLTLQHKVLSLHWISSRDLEEKKRMALGIMCPKKKN